MNGKSWGLPLTATDVAQSWDHLYWFLTWLSVFFFVVVVGGMIYLVFRYRQSKNPNAKMIEGNHTLEIIWTAIPTVLLLVIFGWGWEVYKKMVRVPPNAMEIRVLGKQWAWNFQYDNGRIFVNELYVPLGKPVKLLMSSEDVIHSFFVPNFRIKSDVVPGIYTSVWFEAKIPGEHQVFCTEYCGASHSMMLAKLYVLEPSKWERWERGETVEITPIASDGAASKDRDAVASAGAKNPLRVLPLHEQGKKLVADNGCLACHSVDGSAKLAPSFKGSFGHELEMSDGTKVTSDEQYIRVSILNPSQKIRKGYTPVMPPYQGRLQEVELNAVVAYIKSLNQEPKAVAAQDSQEKRL